uniref:WGS project CAEQ00000000 data, annotated contig 1547 n=1 Tax=Trypanosoma congolense (strain IL3000) TaxID=1068625 RepID=F9W709_TRYCI|nr:unnamed protein product [Trypanosoma congolense IL3000]
MVVDHSGYLQKSSGDFHKTTTTRYFEIRGSKLYYWARKPGKPSEEPINSIDLTDLRVTRDTVNNKSWTIQGERLRKSYTFTADNEEQRDIWIRKMTEVNPIHTEMLQTLDQSSEEDEAVTMYGGENCKVSLSDFEITATVGKGSFSRVYVAVEKATNKRYAIKEMKKEVIEREQMTDHIFAEKFILQKISHPFIVSLHYAFQTKRCLYLVMDFLAGGELFYHLGAVTTFDEWRAKFYCGEIALALGYLHAHDIIYRDLKPENAVLDKDGHVCLTDFGLAKMDVHDASNFTFCGTPEYLAPEFLLGKPHGKAVDWWSLGILLYEMLEGIPPFYSENLNVMYDKILCAELKFGVEGEEGNELPVISEEAQDLLRRLLDRDAATRLQDVEELKAHPFFRDIDWEKLVRREIDPPFHPSSNSLCNFDQEFTSLDPPAPLEDELEEGPTLCGFSFNGNAKAS